MHAVVPPRSGSEVSWKDRIQLDGSAAREAYLPTMGMPGEHEIEIRVCRLSVDLWRVGQQDREFVVRNPCAGFFDVVGPVEVGVIDASEVQSLPFALNRL